jgi:hypothetical protein
LNRIINNLKKEGLLDEQSYQQIEHAQQHQLFSVFWHLKTILYLGVSLVAGGFGILVYKNIDSIGHAAIITLIGIISASCFFYCYKKAFPFSKSKVDSPGIGYDYILLLGCLMLLTFIGYLQWRYLIFGFHYGLAAFIPACAMLFAAYRFDHLGILTLGITLFASWLGLTITPLQLLSNNDFSSVHIIYTGAALALLFGVAAYMHKREDFKKHFAFTYNNFAAHLAGISCVSGMIVLNAWMIWIPLLIAAVYFMHRYAMEEKSFYMLLVAVLYGYTGLSYLFVKIFMLLPEVLAINGTFI